MSRLQIDYNNDPQMVMIDGQWVKMPSRVEARWYQYLCILAKAKEIRNIDYQPGAEDGTGRPTFRFKGETSRPVQYTPDFRVIDCGTGGHIYYECKGIISSDLVSKCRRLATHYPSTRLCIVMGSMPKRGGIQWRRLQRIEQFAVIDRIINARPIFKQLGIR